MDIQKERAAFEKHWIENFDAIDLEDAEYRDDLNMYEHPTLFADDLNKAWSSWQAAKAKVPEGFVLVPKECSDEMAEVIATTANVCGGIANDIYDAVIKQAMIKAAEEEINENR